MDTGQSTETKESIKLAKQLFLTSLSLETIAPEVNKKCEVWSSSKFKNIADAFIDNLSALLRTVGMPMILASSTAQNSHWQRIYSAERIRSLKINLDESFEKKIQKK